MIEKTLGENLGFPEKERPPNIYQGVDHFGTFTSTEEIYSAFDDLFLAAYQPSLFMPETRKAAKKEAASDWKDDVNRERFLVMMMCILFMKRLESSWFSCMSTVKNVLDIHEQTLEKVKAYIANQKDGDLPSLPFDEDEEIGGISDDKYYALRKGTIKLSEMKNIGGFQRALTSDVKKLNAIYKNLLDYKQKYDTGIERDIKLDELERILREKQLQPNKKVVIFTVYADTAQFIFDELTKRGFSNIAAASGTFSCTSYGYSGKDFSTILQQFAPYSKLYKEKDWRDLYDRANLSRGKYYNDDKQQWDVPYDKWLELVDRYDSATASLINKPIDILIATDCLSEGQNLQDADMQINYDIHWNPVRLIQRFGRIDRIGSPNALIRCVNFWPAQSFEDYLHLESRVTNRMAAMNLVGSETQELNDAYKKMVEDNPLQDRNADRLLQELQNNSLSDIESPRTLSLKDFSFEVYRQDLIDYFEKNKAVFRKMPNGIFSGFSFDPKLFEDMGESLVGVIGYPHREEGSNKAYREIFLMCQRWTRQSRYGKRTQPRRDSRISPKEQDVRALHAAMDRNRNSERLSRLSRIMQAWMTAQVPQKATSNILSLMKTNKLTKKNKSDFSGNLDEKFKLENFDLIVWEYITVNS